MTGAGGRKSCQTSNVRREKTVAGVREVRADSPFIYYPDLRLLEDFNPLSVPPSLPSRLLLCRTINDSRPSLASGPHDQLVVDRKEALPRVRRDFDIDI